MTLRLTRLSWPTIRSKLEAGVTTIIIPTASTEQHGPGLPLSVDELRGDALGERIADELGCFLAPTVRPGISSHHMDFPGTISLRPETFEAVIADHCESLAKHGFKNIVLFTTHGGNSTSLAAAADRADDRLDAHIFVAGARDEFSEVRYDAMEVHNVGPDEAGQHAGAAETSFILEIQLELVAMEQRAAGFVGQADEEKILTEGLSSVTENGVLGDQTVASRAAGRTLIESCTQYYAEQIQGELQ